MEVNGKTLGLIGAGNIGRAVIKVALALDMEVLVYSRTPRDYGPGVTCVSLEKLLRRSDYVSLLTAPSPIPPPTSSTRTPWPS